MSVIDLRVGRFGGVFLPGSAAGFLPFRRRWIGIITRQCIRRGTHTSVKVLIDTGDVHLVVVVDWRCAGGAAESAAATALRPQR